MRRFSRGRAATDDEARRTANGTSEAAGDAASETRPAGDAPLPANATGDEPTVVTGSATGGTTSTDAAAANVAGADAAQGDAGATGTPGADATRVDAGTTGTSADATAVAGEPDVPGRDLPAGVDLDELRTAPPGSASRGKLRRRLRYLRHVRELLLRDLGGFYAEAHRSEQGADGHRRLLDVKARRLATLDTEIRELEQQLSEPHAETVIREPGIGGACPECGELFGSGARFCSRCAHPLTGRAARERTRAAGTSAGTTGAGTAPGAGVTGTGGLGPATGAAAEEERMTTASLWGRRHHAAPAEPSEATRAADLTQAVSREPGSEAAGSSESQAAGASPSAPHGEPSGDAAAERPDAAAGERPHDAAEERP